jgi:hypothetical protein
MATSPRLPNRGRAHRLKNCLRELGDAPPLLEADKRCLRDTSVTTLIRGSPVTCP